MLGLRKGDVAPYVLSPGVPRRLKTILKYVSNPRLILEFLLMKAYNGEVEGIPVTVASTGVGSPDSSAAVELYFAAGGEYLIRIGSAGALREDMEIGDLIIVTGAVRGEGTSRYYAPPEFPAVPDPMVTGALVEAAERLDIPYQLGLVWTTDAIFRETPRRVSLWRSLNVKCVDMICSSIFVVSQVLGKRAGAILAISDNVATGELGFHSQRFHDAEDRAVRVALEAVKILNGRLKLS